MNIKLDAADKTFSLFIRLRDKACVRCGRQGEDDRNGDAIIGLQCSHFFGRGNESTRFDPENCDTLCMGCHQYWGSRNHEDYRDFKVKQLGEKGFKDLRTRATLYKKKDRKMSKLIAKALLDDLRNKSK